MQQIKKLMDGIALALTLFAYFNIFIEIVKSRSKYVRLIGIPLFFTGGLYTMAKIINFIR